MAALPEIDQWENGIYQLELTDPVVGGVPNPGTGAGKSNIPLYQLANRSVFLKRVIDNAGLGASAVPLVTLNSAAALLTGSYRFVSSDVNTPAVGVAGTVMVIAASANSVNQTSFDSASSRMWTRFWNGTVWSAWSEVWRTTGVAQSLGGNGWQRLPSGLIIQWGDVPAIPANSSLLLSFPLAFPNGVAGVWPSSGWGTGSLPVLLWENVSGSQFRFHNASTTIGSNFGSFMAIGN